MPGWEEFDTQAIQAQALARAHDLGLTDPPAHLPPDPPEGLRTATEIARRACALNVVIASTFGYSTDLAASWIDAHDLRSELTAREEEWINGVPLGEQAVAGLQSQMEGLWALTWALGLGRAELDWKQHCPDNLTYLPPDPRKGSPREFIVRAALRNAEEIAVERNLAFLLHWWQVASRLEGFAPVPSMLAQPRIVIERRLALMWCTSDEGWSEISLDT